MKIITSADDFGFDDDTTDRTIACLEDGILQGASIMANMPATEQAASYARSRPDLSFGIHLVFCTDTVERPLSPTGAIASLVDGDAFLPSNKVRLGGLLGRLRADEIAVEMQAQLTQLNDMGVAIRYVDSHGHLHKLPAFQRALADVLPRFGIKAVRMAQDVFLGRRGLRPMSYLSPMFNLGLRRRFATTDHFFMPETGDFSDWPSRLLTDLAGQHGTIEVGVHPGHEVNWRRQEEVSIRQLVAAATSAGHRLVGWSATAG